MKYYSGGGDDGSTYICNSRVAKTDKLVKAIGDLDELNAFLGNALSKIKYGNVKDVLKQVEHDLYLLSGELSAHIDKSAPEKKISEKNVKFIEDSIASYAKEIKDITNFIYPNGFDGATSLNVCRTIARRTERTVLDADVSDVYVLKYLNRLSSLLFVMFRYVNKSDNFKEYVFRLD